MTTDTRERDIVRSFIAFSDSLVDDFDVLDVVTRLAEDCARLLDVAAAGLLLADARGELHLLAATSEQARSLEVFQLQRDEGPCLDCYHNGEPVSVADLSTETARWPRFVAAASRRGFASVHAIPMRLRKRTLGALGLFGTTPGDLGAEDLSLAQALAHVATIAILQEHRATGNAAITSRLQSAVASRAVVETAKGVLAEVYEIDTDEAFKRLRRYAREHDQHLAEVAGAAVSGPSAIRKALLGELQGGHAAE
ncbi:MAG: GAF and ANTAR domain-containing protein [Geodermatophilaceae bacterium]|nr:GAF and ANTAR domain-containing protein [Geodermatophilaceae bacterium]